MILRVFLGKTARFVTARLVWKFEMELLGCLL
jgi:hypothetical protein